MAIQRWKEKAIRARNALAKFREESTDAVVHARHDGETVLAGTLMGAIRGSFEATGKDFAIPGPSGTKIQPEVVIGLGALGLAYSMPKSPANGDLRAAGSGVLAYIGGRQAEIWMRTREKNAAPVEAP